MGKNKLRWSNLLFALGGPVFDDKDNRYVDFIKGIQEEEIKLASLNITSQIRIRSLAREMGYAFPRLRETRDEVIQIGKTFGVNSSSFHIKLDMERKRTY